MLKKGKSPRRAKESSIVPTSLLESSMVSFNQFISVMGKVGLG